MAPISVSIFGGGGALGLRFLPLLRTHNVKIKCLVRGSENRLNASVRHCVDELVVGDVLTPEIALKMCQESDIVVSMLTPSPLHDHFVAHHVKNMEAIIKAVDTLRLQNILKSTHSPSPPPRLVIVGGAGIMERSWQKNSSKVDKEKADNGSLHHFSSLEGQSPFKEATCSYGSFVTDTFPGKIVKQILPIYNDFFVSHKLNLRLLQESGLPFTMICPGFLRHSQEFGKPSAAKDVRIWKNTNDEQFGGLSATYEDVASLLVDEVLHGKNAGVGKEGTRVGIESSHWYYPSLIPSVVTVVQWQLQKWGVWRQ